MKKLFFLLVILFLFFSPFVISSYADTTESSPCVVTAIGKVTSPGSLPAGCSSSTTGIQVVDYANQLVTAAQEKCHTNTYDFKGNPVSNKYGAITNANSSCLSDQIATLSWSYPASAIAQVTTLEDYGIDPNVATFYQCVGFVETVIAGALNTTPLAGVASAADYQTEVPNGYSYINKTTPGAKIAPGDLVIYTDGGPGHIAIVTKEMDTTDPNNPYTFIVAEANYNYDGWLNNTRLDSYNGDGFVGWLHKQQ